MSRIKSIAIATATAIGLASAATSVPAQAQDAQPLSVEGGAIPAGADSATSLVDASGNTPLVVDVMPVGMEWDTVITVTDMTTGELIGEDDDGGNGLASRLVIPASFAGVANIEVRNVSGANETAPMRYVVMVSEFVAPQITVSPITIGDRLQGNIAGGGEAYYEFTASAGQSLELAVSAADEAWDTYAEVFTRDSAGVGDPVVANDDKGSGSLDSFITFIAPAAGDYVLRVSTIGEEGGDYTVSMARGPDVSGPEAFRPIGFGETRRIVFYNDPSSGGEADPAQLIALSDAAKAAIASGARYATISLTGVREETDPVVAAGFMTPFGFASVAEDDDGAGNLNSRLAIDLSKLADPTWRDGFRIQMRTISAGVSAIELRVDLRD